MQEMQEPQASIVNATVENFQNDIVERSKQTPVIMLFWADQVPPSVDARRVLEQQVTAAAGKALLALVDVAADPTLAQHLRVQGLPSVRVIVDGQIADQLEGPQPDEAYVQLVETLTLSGADLIKAQLEQVLASGDFDSAIEMLQQAVNDEPSNMAFRVEFADVLVRGGRLDDARSVLASIPEDTAERERPQQRLEFAEEAAGLGELAVAETAVSADDDDLEARYRCAVLYAASGDYEQALDSAMAILQADRGFRDDIGRLTMIRIFAVLGKGSELASAYRRRMFNFMH